MGPPALPSVSSFHYTHLFSMRFYGIFTTCGGCHADVITWFSLRLSPVATQSPLAPPLTPASTKLFCSSVILIF